MLGLAAAARKHYDTVIASFSESGLCEDYLTHAQQLGFSAIRLKWDTPFLYAAFCELKQLIRETGVDVIACQGYKAGLLGWLAARATGTPAVAVSRGWTGECGRVRVYEWIDKRVLRQVDRVVCVSRAQALKVVAAGVRSDFVEVIHNSVCSDRFKQIDPLYRLKLIDYFPPSTRSRIRFVVGAAGRLSPEKGFDILIDAVCNVIEQRGDIGVIIFGEGPLHPVLKEQIQGLGIGNHCVLAGFCDELDQFMPHLNLFVQSSHTEGLPNVLLEALAARVPVVATDAGGTCELLDQGRCGTLIPCGDVCQLGEAVLRLISQPGVRAQQVSAGTKWITDHFTFERQADAYMKLFSILADRVDV